jgi:hypothetical protein
MNLSDLDPNLLAGIVTLLGTLATWAYGKARGTKQADLSDLLDEAITAEVYDALNDGETVDTIEDRLAGVAMKLGAKVGLKVPKATARLAVQYGVFEFKKLVKARELKQQLKQQNANAVERLPGQVADMAKAAQGVLDAFTPKGTIPKLQAGDVEIIK